MGTWKVRLTGGEPTLRQDFCEIAKSISSMPAIKKLAFTTNGYRLAQRAKSYFDAGFREINISVDSLNPRTFHEITGHNRLSEVLSGIDAALEAGFESVKVNSVLLKGMNDEELDSFLFFAREKPVSLRFIELMQTGENLSYFRRHHVSSTAIKERILSEGWALFPKPDGGGPANEYVHPEYSGKIGIIAPYSKDFCSSCNRLRISAYGKLHLCLFGTGGYDLRPFLQNDSQKEELKTTVMGLLSRKAAGHYLDVGNTGVRKNLATIGG